MVAIAKKELKSKYKFVAQDKKTGAAKQGTVTAVSEAVVRENFLEKGWLPISIQEVESEGLNTEIKLPFGGRVKPKDIALWARNFSIMFNAGLSIVKILGILEEQSTNGKLGKISQDIKEDIENGSTLAIAIGKHDAFPPLVVSMVKAGEESGDLDVTMKRIAETLESDVRLRGKIKSAMTYPIVVLGLTVVMVTIMLIFIVPTFSSMFESLGGELPAPTQLLVTMSDVLKVTAIPLVIFIVAFVLWWRKNKNQSWVRNILDPIKLRLPIFGKLFQMVAVGRFTRNLGTLLSSGVNILPALDIVAETTGNVVVSRAVLDAKRSVSVGRTMSSALAEHPVFPTMVTQMVAVGEDAGGIDQMLDKVADMYDEQIANTTEALTSLLEPLLITFLGVVVGGMIVALYLPIFSIYELIQ